MARTLKWYSLCMLLGLIWHTEAMGQETPKLRTLEGRVSVTDTAEPPSKPQKTAAFSPKTQLPAVPVASKTTKKSLAERVKSILNEKTLKLTTVGIQIVDLDSGDIVYAHNENTFLKPASNTKLVTTAAALNILGPEYQFESAIYTDGKIEKGVLKGNLHLHIDHDFTWSTRFYSAGDVPMRGLIQQIRDAGIHKITGDVIVSGYVVYGGLATGTLSTITHLKRAGNQFGALLKKSKISYGGLHIQQSAKTEGKKIASWLSPVLSEAIVPLNRASHNEYADMLMLAIGDKTSHTNTYEAGAKGVKAWLKDAGLSVKGFEIHDGSGLSHDNRMTADFFTNLVKYMLQSPVGREWAASMAIAGYDGTYGGRLAIDDGKGRVYAKSGTLRDTISGSGFFVNRHDGHTYAFSIIVNGMKNRKLTRQSIDRILRVFLGNHLNAPMPQTPRMESLTKEKDGRVMARWQSVKEAVGYRVYHSEDGNTWSVLSEPTVNELSLKEAPHHIRVTSVNSKGAESAPSLIYSYRPGAKTLRIVEEAKCRHDAAMRPDGHVFSHERPLANLVGNDWGIETVQKLGGTAKEGVLFHSTACEGSIAWNPEDYQSALQAKVPVIVNISDAHTSEAAGGTCAPKSGKVLGCFGEPVVAKDRRLGAGKLNQRLRKAAGTGSGRPSQVQTWTNGKPIFEMSSTNVATQEKLESGGSLTVIGFDLQSIDSQKTLNAVWKKLAISN